MPIEFVYYFLEPDYGNFMQLSLRRTLHRSHLSLSYRTLAAKITGSIRVRRNEDR